MANHFSIPLYLKFHIVEVCEGSVEGIRALHFNIYIFLNNFTPVESEQLFGRLISPYSIV